MKTLLYRISASLRDAEAAGHGEHIVAAISGGPDSMFLLDVLRHLSDKLGFNLSAAHLEHGMRGQESRDDCAFVEEICGEWKVPLQIGSANVKKENGQSLEETARNSRYRFLLGAAEEVGARWIATGHTADDQDETVLLRVKRGTGIEGLRGILSRRPVLDGSGVSLIRPILSVSRQEIVAYLRERGVAWRTDSTNNDVRFSRNLVRQWLSRIPDSGRRALGSTLRRFSACAVKDWTRVHTEASRIVRDVSDDGKTIVFDIGSADVTHTSIIPYVARELIRKASGDLRRITSHHVEGVAALLNRSSSGPVELPDGVVAVREYDKVRIGTPPSDTIYFEDTLSVPGEVSMPDGATISAQPVQGDCRAAMRKHANDSTVEFVRGDKLSAPLTVRTRKNGDRLRPLGLSGEKKLKDFLIDEKVPRSRRDSVPLVASGHDIVWVVGYRLDGRFALGDGVHEAVRLTYTGGRSE